MTLIAEKEMEHIGESKGAADHDHDMVHELGKRLDAFWRYDQYIANADCDSDLQRFWKDLKTQEKSNIDKLKKFISRHCDKGCF